MLIASDLLRTELEASDWRIQALVTDAVRIAGLAGYHLRLTGVRRSRTRTLEIYLRAGKPAPPSSVHEATPCRGADLVPVPAATGTDAGADMAAAMAYGPSLAEAINRGWRYPRGKPSALWHSVSGLHLHLQVSYDAIELLP